MTERLVAAALIRDGKTESRGFKTHFVGRGAAALIGHEAGQVRYIGARLLSSDVNWNATPARGPGEKSASLQKLLRK